MPPMSASFATTHWTLIVAAQGRDAPEAREALAALCQSYWYPLYAFVRRQGHSADEAQDLTQEFFARLLEMDFLAAADREKGRVRSFLPRRGQPFPRQGVRRAKGEKAGGGADHCPSRLRGRGVALRPRPGAHGTRRKAVRPPLGVGIDRPCSRPSS